MILNATGSALHTTLQGTALTSLLAGTNSIYHLQAPDNDPLPYCVFNHQGGGPENVDANALEANLWYVRIYTATPGTASIIFEKADNLLNRVNISITGYNTIWCAREENIELVENTPSGKIYSAGGVYRIRTA